jgi:uncharacterized protein (DUF1501 family)
MPSRRDFLKAALRDSSLLALAPSVPGFLAATARAVEPDHDGRALVVIQLDGGNDGINTVVPFRDEGYARFRKALRLPSEKLLKLGNGNGDADAVGLHPAMTEAAKLLERGELAIIQGVGYPNPSRSHFRSMAVWHSARTDPEEHPGPGWLGRVFDERLARGDRSGAYFVGEGAPPAALRGRRSAPAALERAEDFVLDGPADPRATLGGRGEDADAGDLAAFVRRSTLDAYAAADRMAELARADRSTGSYRGGALGTRLALVARLLKSGAGARVYYTQQAGYDTHAGQLNTHARLLSELSAALGSFCADLAESGLADRVAVLCFSEFGRRVAENGSAGTDHGTAGPVLLAGRRVRGGLIGRTPSLLDLEDSDLRMGVDFRRVYASVLEDWLGLPSRDALGGAFEPLPLFSPT